MGQSISCRKNTNTKRISEMMLQTFEINENNYKQYSDLKIDFNKNPLLSYKSFASQLYGYILEFQKIYSPDYETEVLEKEIVIKLCNVAIKYIDKKNEIIEQKNKVK